MNPHERMAEQVEVPDKMSEWIQAVTYRTTLSSYEARALWFYLHGRDLDKYAAYFNEPRDKIEGWLDSALTEYEKARWLTSYVESTAGGPPTPTESLEDHR